MSRVPVFTTTLPASADSNPVIAGTTLFVETSDSEVQAVDTQSGAILYKLALPAAGGVDMAIGDQVLVVPTGDDLTAFG